jgi:hypothetical protein
MSQLLKQKNKELLSKGKDYQLQDLDKSDCLKLDDYLCKINPQQKLSAGLSGMFTSKKKKVRSKP